MNDRSDRSVIALRSFGIWCDRSPWHVLYNLEDSLILEPSWLTLSLLNTLVIYEVTTQYNWLQTQYNFPPCHNNT
jgi:hypothetical protein